MSKNSAYGRQHNLLTCAIVAPIPKESKCKISWFNEKGGGCTSGHDTFAHGTSSNDTSGNDISANNTSSQYTSGQFSSSLAPFS